MLNLSLILLIGVFASLALVGCQSPMTPSIHRKEAEILQTDFYWSPETQLSTYTQGRYPESLFLKAADPTLDGGGSEGLTTRLLLALAVLGDEEFAARLAGQEPHVQNATLRFVSSIWRNHKGFRYPATQALWQRVGSPC